MKRKHRVRMHLVDPHPDSNLPSVEGILHATHLREYVLTVASLIVAPHGTPAELESRELVIPRERVAFYEVLR